MAAAQGAPGYALEPEKLFPHLEGLLSPPLERGITAEREPLVRGHYAGRPTMLRREVVTSDYSYAGTSLGIVMTGKTYDLDCRVEPPAVLNRLGAPLGDAAFDARFDVIGAPQAVFAHLFGPEMRAAMLANRSWLRFGPDCLEISLGMGARTVESVGQQLALAASLLDRLPGALRAADLGHYLELGSLRSHPELVALQARRAERRSVFVRAALVIGVVSIAGAILLAVLVGIALLLLART